MRCNQKTFVALLAAPLLLAAAVSADEDEDFAVDLESNCDWNLAMCCWKDHESYDANTDVCRVLDYPSPGETLEFPRTDEGPVYCHGFGWEEDEDILPLYIHVKSFGTSDGGGFHDSVEGAPMCGCIDEMPVVDDAACSRMRSDGVEDCDMTLEEHYRKEWRMDEPNGPLDINLVGECDNRALPTDDFGACEYNTFMCCWTDSDGGYGDYELSDNTDVCYVGDVGYPGNEEGDVHCHGFVWTDDYTELEIQMLGQYVITFNHAEKKGYYGNLPGAPMCACLEDMPEVSHSDCSKPDEDASRGYSACPGQDLRRRFEYLFGDDYLPNLVEECDNE